MAFRALSPLTLSGAPPRSARTTSLLTGLLPSSWRYSGQQVIG